MAINNNTQPYFDDFDPNKNFNRILFKPGVAVQARELTQSQTILQNQISNFASSIFTQNTPVSGGQVTTNLNCYFIKLNTTYNGGNISASSFINKVIQDSTGTILAKVIATTETTTSGTTLGDPPTLIVTYLSGIHFADGLVITPTDGTNAFATVATSTINNASTGLSSTASISNGVFYVVNGYSQSQTENADGTFSTYSIGNFVTVSPQTIILDKYDNSPSLRVGLQITETIHDYVDDVSLLDPAIGASNYQAPGADRYVITLNLITLPTTLGNDAGFIELVRIVNGSIVKQVDGTVYSTIDDYFAKRDYETNGDYVVNDFKLTPSANSLSVSSQYDLSVSKGIAYVHGYRVENQSNIQLTNQRAQSTANITNNAVFVDYGNYYVCDTANGVFDISTLPSVDLHCVPAANIVSTNANTYTSTLVGSALMRNMSYVAGSGSNTKAYIYNTYISDFATNTLSGNVTSGTATTLTINDTINAFSSSANAYFNTTINTTTGGITDTRNIVNYNGATKVITVDNPFSVLPTSSTTFNILFQSFDTESIVKTVGSGNYNITANTNINSPLGKVNGLSTGDTILNNPGTPELLFQIGYPYVAQVVNTAYYSQRVYRAKSFSGSTLTIQATSGNSSSPLKFEGASTLSGAAAEQLFIVVDNSNGSILDFTSSGNTITISADKTTATLSSATYANKNVTVLAQVQVSSGDSSSYVLKSKSIVSGNTTYASTSYSAIGGTNVSQDLTKGQVLIAKAGIVSGTKMSLYVNDVKNIVKVIDTGNAATTPTGALSAYTDITNYFTLDNGQRDSFYDHASITLVPGAPLPVGKILVVVNYYSHTQASSGDGYFSVQSYESSGSTFGGVSTSPESYAQIPIYTAKDGFVYKLSDVIDFRPCRLNGQTAYTWEYSQTQTSTNDIGILLPNNLSNFTSYYQYYLGRQDRLVLTKDKSFQIIQGTPSVTPSLPIAPKGSLLLANLLHDPYTAYVPGEGPIGSVSNLSINKVLHKRWAKSDITDLETRVNNLEYYTSLSILEQNAQSLQVPDVNGLNRFKNGILVDDFSSFSTADTANPDYAANINVRTNQMTALQQVNNFQLQNPVVMASLGTLQSTGTYAINSINGTQTNIFTLPYTTATIVSQPLASNTVSVNPFSVVVQQGIAQLNPPMDNWVDNTQAPAILITDPSMQVYQATSGVHLINSGDMQTIPGTSSTITSSVSVLNHGTLASGVSPYGGSVGFTATTTQTYASQLGNSTSGAYNPVSSTLGSNNGYLTNIAILPYIRPQQLTVRVSGLLVNTPVSTYFDGANVASYMTAPNTIELVGVTGQFKQDDIVGFYVSASSTFYPVARVISIYNYPSGTKARLYVADIIGAPNTVGSTTIQNGLFDINGNYIPNSATATGNIGNSSGANSIISLSQSGSLSGVGGGYANTLSAGVLTQLYGSPIVQGYSSFLNNYGVWGDVTNSKTYVSTIPVTFTTAGNYTVTVGCSGVATLFANGVAIGNSLTNTPASTTSFTYAATASTVNIGWNATSSGTTTSAFALTIVDSSGTVVFSSITPPVTYTNAGTEVLMPGGGAWFVGATQLALDPVTSSNVANYYVGTTINIQSMYVYSMNVAATYVPPAPAPSGGAGSNGGLVGALLGQPSCCVIATALTAGGDWTEKQRMGLVNWSINTLDKSFIGERLHRGYHIVAPKLVPILVKKKTGILRKYIKWTFSNATNMMQGKKFNPLSAPNSMVWILSMFVVGLCVNKSTAESSWKSLYKDKK